MTDVGIHLRAFNWSLWQRRKAHNLSQIQLATLVGMPTQTLSRIETLRQWPTWEQQQELADALETTIAELFPPHLEELVEQRLPSSIRFRVPLEALPRGVIHELSEPSDRLELVDLRYHLGKAINTLSPRERFIILRRFGLDGDPCQTYEEIGRELKVTRERIRQIGQKALRKLRHPSRSQSLKAYS